MAPPTENERQEAYGRLSCYFNLHTVCGIALLIIGSISLSVLSSDRRWNTSYWYQIYYGAYIVAGIIFVKLFVTYRVFKAEEQRRYIDVNAGIGRIKILLCVLFVGLVVGAVFLGNFITHSNALGECHFSTSSNDTMTRTEEENQCSTYKGSSIACIVFFILAFYIMIRNCDDRKIENEKIVHPATRTTPSTTTVTVTPCVEQDDVSLREVSFETPSIASPESSQRHSAPETPFVVSTSAPAIHEAQSQQTPRTFSEPPPRYSQVIKQPV